MFPTLLPHSSRRRLLLTALLLTLVALGAFQLRSSLAAPAVPPGGALPGTVVVGSSYNNDTSPPLREMPQLPLRMQPQREANRNPAVGLRHQNAPDSSAVQNLLAPLAMPTPILSFDGVAFPGVNCNCAPPDTDGEVGATQYVQIVNEGYQVFNKTTGASVLGPSAISSIWAGFGGVCQNNGNGDPVVLYDQLANRWLISQFAGTSVPTDECIAVSTTNDATGSYNRYGFHLGNKFFDYPHLGVWPDAYYMSMNVFNTAGTAFLGPQPFAFDRTRMLAGLSATFVSTGVTGGPNESVALPADLDGSTLPTAGAPATFVEFPDTGAYRTFHFHVDFTTPANSTFTLFASPAAAAFTGLCGFGATPACVPQLGSPDNLDGIGDRLMFRLAYRKFSDGHEAVVGNYSVAASNGGVAAPRWFELRNVTAGPVTVFQESTYQPDATSRWMGSAAMDGAGNMALGFSASSATSFPQVRYAGRLATDPLNTLAQGEATLFAGTGSQLQTGNRWGDYSDMTVDPTDDSTFWYTQEYYAATAAFAWRTRIGNFKFPPVGTPTATTTAVAASATTTATAVANTATSTATAVANTATATATACPLGQTYTVTSGAGVIVPGVTDIGNHCDDCGTGITLPFPVTLYDQTYNTAQAGSNGYLSFGTADDFFYTGCLPHTGSTYNIFPFATDQITGATGKGVFTLTTGVAPNRTFYVEWRACRYNGATTCLAGSDSNYEVVFQEGQTTYSIVYGTFGAANATVGAIGVQKNTTVYTQSQCNAGAPAATQQTYTLGCVVATATVTTIPNTATLTSVPTVTQTATTIPTVTRTATTVTTVTQTATSILPTITLTVLPASATATQTVVPTTATTTRTATAPASTATTTATPVTTVTQTATSILPTITLTVLPASATTTQTTTPVANTATTTRTATTVAPSATTTQTATSILPTITLTVPPTVTQTQTSVAPSATSTATQTAPADTATSTATQTAPADTATSTATQTPPANTATVTATATACPGAIQTFSGSIGPSDPSHTSVVSATGAPSSCAAPHGYPGTFGTAPYNYDTYTVTNTSSSPQCITVLVNGSGCGSTSDGVQVNLYQGSFDPNNLAAHYLGDSGSDGVIGQRTLSVTVPGNTALVIVVDEYTNTRGCASYTLTVSGLPCATGTATATSVATTPTATGTPAATATPCTIRFTDVTDPTAYYYTGVYYLACHGVISGYSDGTYRPFNNTTRGQMTKIVTLAFNIPLVTPPALDSRTFTDVTPDNVFYQLIETAAARQIVTGYSCGGVNSQTGAPEPCDSARRPYFRPSNFVTRGQLTKIVVLGAGFTLINPPTPTFTDVARDNVFYPFIETAVCHGAISGYDDHTFRPNNYAFRGQIAKIVYLAVTNPRGNCLGGIPTR
ncbi:MAG: S-layer homology domain-containing protein [Chloroflexota bacterium]|nr:S-layer homology domain-containing protein [Chloroflexota bacterium]